MECLNSSPVFCGIRVATSCVFCVPYCRSLFFCPVYFRHCMVCLLRFMVSYYRFVIFKDVFDDVCMSMFASLLKGNDLYELYLVLSLSFCVFLIIFDRLVAYLFDHLPWHKILSQTDAVKLKIANATYNICVTVSENDYALKTCGEFAEIDEKTHCTHNLENDILRPSWIWSRTVFPNHIRCDLSHKLITNMQNSYYF